MKSINEIFKNNKGLMTQPEVIELIDYCEELENDVLERQLNERYNKETILLEFLREISLGCDTIIETQKENKRFRFEDVDFEEALHGLDGNIKQFFKDNY